MISAAALLVTCASLADSQGADAKATIERALPYLERGGESWMQEQSCVSCHRVSFLIWTHQEARSRGIVIDDEKLEGWTNWALVDTLARREDGGGIDSMSQLLLGRDRASSWRRKPPNHFKTADPYETLYQFLLERQEADGSWPPEGQLTTPPELTTGWVLLALASRDETAGDPGVGLDPDDDLGDPLATQLVSIEEKLPEARRRAFAYLEGVAPHPTHEAFLLRVLTEHLRGGTAAEGLRERLFAGQNADGGWSNLGGHPDSDAYATGQTLYALSHLEAPRDHPALRRAREFLVRTQQEDGAWSVSGERIRVGESSESVDEVFTYWGTAWAVLGLLRALP